MAPACLQKGLLTIGALDNLDHNPSSTTAVNAFHGTGISLFQFPTRDNPGEGRPPLTAPPSKIKRHHLPDSYAIVPAVVLKTSAVDVRVLPMETCLEEDIPVLATSMQPCLVEAISKEKRWVEHALALFEKGELSEDGLHIMLHSNLPQKTLQQCVHYCRFSTKSPLPLQW